MAPDYRWHGIPVDIAPDSGAPQANAPAKYPLQEFKTLRVTIQRGHEL